MCVTPGRCLHFSEPLCPPLNDNPSCQECRENSVRPFYLVADPPSHMLTFCLVAFCPQALPLLFLRLEASFLRCHSSFSSSSSQLTGHSSRRAAVGPLARGASHPPPYHLFRRWQVNSVWNLLVHVLVYLIIVFLPPKHQQRQGRDCVDFVHSCLPSNQHSAWDTVCTWNIESLQ